MSIWHIRKRKSGVAVHRKFKVCLGNLVGPFLKVKKGTWLRVKALGSIPGVERNSPPPKRTKTEENKPGELKELVRGIRFRNNLVWK